MPAVIFFAAAAVARPRALRKTPACSFADHLSHAEGKLSMNKGEMISRMVEELEGKSDSKTVAENGLSRIFSSRNEQDYYQAHDVLDISGSRRRG